ncbi:MAG: hypothetical protein KY442_08135 [Proteobacteria bacterium]|nr:hypothetical protein [Pseudomonadota bacterium]
MTVHTHSPRDGFPPIDPRLEATLRYAVAIGAVLLLLLPAARGHHAQLGWLPLWLLAMPLSAWWALHRFPLPGRASRPSWPPSEVKSPLTRGSWPPNST